VNTPPLFANLHEDGETTTIEFDASLSTSVDVRAPEALCGAGLGMADSMCVGISTKERQQQTLKVVDMLQHKLTEQAIYTREHLVDLPEIANWHRTDDSNDPVAPPPIARMAVQTFTNA
jgi:hypothetical protein